MTSPKRGFSVVLVTAPNLDVARTLAKSVLEARLAACVNLLPQVESYFWWKGKIDASNEILMLIKTRSDLLQALQERVIREHPYDTPEFVVLAITKANKQYLDWIERSTDPERAA